MMARILVVTGGIGSGKSEVCRILKDMGFDAQYNADRRVKALYSEHPTLLDEIEESLHVSLRDSDGTFQPKRLSEIIFADRSALDKVETIVFPVLTDDFSSFASMHSDEKIIIFESATILEKPFFNGFGDKTVFVAAPYSTRLSRACMRDGADREAVEARMSNQELMNSISEGMDDQRIDAVIINDSGLGELKERTREVISHLFDN